MFLEREEKKNQLKITKTTIFKENIIKKMFCLKIYLSYKIL